MQNRFHLSYVQPRLYSAVKVWLVALLMIGGVTVIHAQGNLSAADLERIGKRIWQNECAGQVSGLTSWNSGENFASLGIGHFIWYPAGQSGPFEESFPPLVAYLRRSGVAVPQWLVTTQKCPWPDRSSFQKDKNSPRQQELRALLSQTVKEQTLFIIARLDAATPRFQSPAGQAGARVMANIAALRQTAAGNFAMIDYVNFKGEGLSASERYNGQGWGLLQVLETMPPSDARSAPAAFADAAKQVLTRRVQNSPQAKKEQQWLPGWLKRCAAYAH